MINDYFSVFRNALQEIDKWKRVLDTDQVRRIRAIVEPSEAFTECATLAEWSW
jgi:hypothetical protein